jgi:pimeloyl-ACP methyl ester carboxylesterase
MSYPPEPPAESQPGPVTEPPARGDRRRIVLVAVVGVVALAVVVALVIASTREGKTTGSVSTPRPVQTSATSPSSASTPLPGTDPALKRFYGQKLDWHGCGRDQCALLTVPLSYARPTGKTLDLAVLKVPAEDKSARIGSLVVNPGGPGGSGVNYAAAGSLQFGAPLSRAYDIVGFDPRGVGQSDPLHCVDTQELDALVAFDPDPETAPERNQMDRLIRGFGQGCLDHSGALARHMSTEEAARDMDILRAALGERKLDYLGASYGTFLGATYADLFPRHVGRFVLDGAIDPSLSNEQLTLAQAHGFETALRAYVKDCVDRGSCFLGSNVDDGLKRIQAFFGQVEKTPLPTGEDRQLTEGLAMLGVWMPLYVKEYWGQLTTGLKQAFDGDGSVLLGLADTYTSRGPSGYTDNSMEALYAVNCLDHDDYIPTKDVPTHFAQFEKAAPTFGRAFAFGLSTCSNWPVQSGHRTTALHAAGAPPIVVVGTTRDPATPLSWAQALAAQLDSGRLITRDGDGHTGFQRGNSCVDSAVEKWLISGVAPKPDLKC